MGLYNLSASGFPRLFPFGSFFFYFFPKLTQVGSFYDPLVFKIVASGYTGKRLIFVFCTKNSNFATVVVIVFQ